MRMDLAAAAQTVLSVSGEDRLAAKEWLHAANASVEQWQPEATCNQTSCSTSNGNESSVVTGGKASIVGGCESSVIAGSESSVVSGCESSIVSGGQVALDSTVIPWRDP